MLVTPGGGSVSVKDDVIETGATSMQNSCSNIIYLYEMWEEVCNRMLNEMSGESKQCFLQASNGIATDIYKVKKTLTNLSFELLAFSADMRRADAMAKIGAGGKTHE